MGDGGRYPRASPFAHQTESFLVSQLQATETVKVAKKSPFAAEKGVLEPADELSVEFYAVRYLLSVTREQVARIELA